MGWCEPGTKFQGIPIEPVPAKAVGSAVEGDGRGCPCCGHHRLSEVSIPSFHDITVCLGCGVAFHTASPYHIYTLVTSLRAKVDDGHTLSRAAQQFLDEYEAEQEVA